jgi:hypothetical protein
MSALKQLQKEFITVRWSRICFYLLLMFLVCSHQVWAQTCNNMTGTWKDSPWTFSIYPGGGTLTLNAPNPPNSNNFTGTYTFSGGGCGTADVYGTKFGQVFQLDVYVGPNCLWHSITNPPDHPPVPMHWVRFQGTILAGCRVADMSYLIEGEWPYWQVFGGNLAFGYFPTTETTTKNNITYRYLRPEDAPAPGQPVPPNRVRIGYRFKVEPKEHANGHDFLGNRVNELIDLSPGKTSVDNCFPLGIPNDPLRPLELTNGIFAQAFNGRWKVNPSHVLEGWSVDQNVYTGQISDVVGLPYPTVTYYRNRLRALGLDSCVIETNQLMAMQTGAFQNLLPYKSNHIKFEIKRANQMIVTRDTVSGNVEGVATVLWPDLPAPTTLIASNASASEIQLAWDKPTSDDITGFLLWKREGSGGWAALSQSLSWASVCGSSATCSYSGPAVTNLTQGTEYCFKLQAATNYTHIDIESPFPEDYGEEFSNTACAIPGGPQGFHGAGSPYITYQGPWNYGLNYYQWEQLSSNTWNSTATFTFYGDSVTWYYSENWWSGVAHIVIDGNYVESWSLFAPWEALGVSRTYSGLGTGQHTIQIVNAGWSVPESWGLDVDVLGFEVGLNPIVGPGVHGGATWYAGYNWNMVGPAGWTCNPLDSARLNFVGTSVTWKHFVGPEGGWAVITIDGVTHATINLYNPDKEFDHADTFGGLSYGPHVLHISNFDHCIDVEGFIVN